MTAATLPPLLLVGGGKMGGAMLKGWREKGLERAVVLDPSSAAAQLAEGAGGKITVVTSLAEVPQDFAPKAVIIAVKPQIAGDVAPDLARFADSAVFISIMAGKTLDWLTARLGAKAAIVRAMPNLPASIGAGMTAACPGPNVTADQRDLTLALLSAVGEAALIEDESQIDTVTAISGSGPAYGFLLAELLEKEAIARGIAPELARRLACRTVAGAGAMLAAEGAEPETLRRAVMSPGGTTEAAIKRLIEPESWPKSVHDAVEAAATRSRELAD